MRAGLSFMLHVATDARSNAVHGAGDDAERFTMQRRHGRWPFNWGARCDSKHRRICLQRGSARLLVARCAREARRSPPPARCTAFDSPGRTPPSLLQSATPQPMRAPAQGALMTERSKACTRHSSRHCTGFFA
ncbi:hypothetical protein XCR_4204 [Xanthomonas campestris pv. raphani 756C]|nr:hypothetical protein XCR_4204 [Xanthomonas campestris pv. raphani 756C]